MNSAEGVAETIKMESMMAACVRMKSTQTRYWDNYGDFILERDENLNATVFSTAIVLHSRLLDALRQGLMDEYPEKRYLKSAEERLLDREVEEEVVNVLRNRAETAIEELDKKEAIKAVAGAVKNIVRQSKKKKKKKKKKKTTRKKKASGR